ncbi:MULTISPECIES: VanY-A/VanY-F/VanY-M family D-Ala-D-Ala carboxypeptidase [Metabacillus]|uniref:VanY-A/VanY-F/VanY-M family D-Ala-D-Ala carboxypeptidase n=1 Tax=Metabacillus hrfriensis TaxID=3048891 RepID=A0ACD4RIF2_9BACI|nr:MULTISPECIES: VanY-A/VanY-F/VanY-M family D-Ala-D-Ala carboxypeptidase [Metabacillus]UAL54390.1 VanY-A/VanY-F/VanY-M family D-Ala-D-Ala carboxypeptidase [Metabacillus dongyingensis]USK30705.1 VanY-A/VanY-F/VanY-M family D-Ala-D-Ala carboxypeptidase [Bacillus sp. CMF21]WHZ59957.1 VanY-A/VanY-F/VanY-M family D-Ala-D-Ala carboxypeptidase [Metabacillus sp. CT-WN-B3]
MKTWGFLFFLILCLGFAIGNITPLFQDKVEFQKNAQNHQDNINYLGTSERIQNNEIAEDQIYQGNLLLVNKEYPVHQESIKSDVVNLFKHKELIKGYELLNSDIKLSEDVARNFSEMTTAAEKEGVRHFLINSGFREFEEQSVLYQEMGSDYALPAGFSEHNLGLSLDVGSTQMKMSEAPEGKWIEENAWKYGFILRYPKDKTDVTGIQYEPWHIRYVGLPHSAIMKDKNLALEEYLDYLKEEKNISASVNEKKYTVTYYSISHSSPIKVPEDLYYEISGNNMDGVIVTVHE